MATPTKYDPFGVGVQLSDALSWFCMAALDYAEAVRKSEALKDGNWEEYKASLVERDNLWMKMMEAAATYGNMSKSLQ